MSVLEDRVTYRAFKSEESFIEDIYSVYEEFYDLPSFVHEVTLDNEAMFEYVSKRRFFVNILPYTRTKKVLLTPTFFDKRFAWRILGGGLRKSYNNNFISIGYYHVSKYLKMHRSAK